MAPSEAAQGKGWVPLRKGRLRKADNGLDLVRQLSGDWLCIADLSRTVVSGVYLEWWHLSFDLAFCH